jgi:hypothetical protein
VAIPGFPKQIELTLAATLQQAFSAPSGSPVGVWTDDGGYARQVTIRGKWSTEPTSYALMAIQSLVRPGPSQPAGGRVSQTQRGGIQPVTIEIQVVTPGADERPQLSNLLLSTLTTQANANNVPWSMVLRGQGIDLLAYGGDRYSESRQDQDPAHGPVAFVNTMTWQARAQYVQTRVVTALGTVSLTFTLATRPGSIPLWRSVTL